MKDRAMLMFVGVGFELLILVMGFIYLGQIIDETYKTKGLATIVCIFLALISWVVHLIHLLKRWEKLKNKNSDL